MAVSHLLSAISASVTALLAAATALLGTAPPALAAFCDPLVNGTYTAVSDGTWAKTNEVYHDEKSVTSTWTVSTSCNASGDCAGHVTSSQGWGAPIACESGSLWHVRRHLDQWEPCGDGTRTPAEQLLYFSADLYEKPTLDAVNTFSGWDRTAGVSGGCGINMPLVIEMPFTLTKT